jgi:hypothetical protein
MLLSCRWSLRKDEALAEFARILKPHGRLALFWNYRDPAASAVTRGLNEGRGAPTQQRRQRRAARSFTRSLAMAQCSTAWLARFRRSTSWRPPSPATSVRLCPRSAPATTTTYSALTAAASRDACRGGLRTSRSSRAGQPVTCAQACEGLVLLRCVCSSSYAPKEGAARQQLEERLDSLFDSFVEPDGCVALRYSTVRAQAARRLRARSLQLTAAPWRPGAVSGGAACQRQAVATLFDVYSYQPAKHAACYNPLHCAALRWVGLEYVS